MSVADGCPYSDTFPLYSLCQSTMCRFSSSSTPVTKYKSGLNFTRTVPNKKNMIMKQKDLGIFEPENIFLRKA